MQSNKQHQGAISKVVPQVALQMIMPLPKGYGNFALMPALEKVINSQLFVKIIRMIEHWLTTLHRKSEVGVYQLPTNHNKVVVGTLPPLNIG